MGKVLGFRGARCSEIWSNCLSVYTAQHPRKLESSFKRWENHNSRMVNRDMFRRSVLSQYSGCSSLRIASVLEYKEITLSWISLLIYRWRQGNLWEDLDRNTYYLIIQWFVDLCGYKCERHRILPFFYLCDEQRGVCFFVVDVAMRLLQLVLSNIRPWWQMRYVSLCLHTSLFWIVLAGVGCIFCLVWSSCVSMCSHVKMFYRCKELKKKSG